MLHKIAEMDLWAVTASGDRNEVNATPFDRKGGGREKISVERAWKEGELKQHGEEEERPEGPSSTYASRWSLSALEGRRFSFFTKPS